jgi:hypothetical protein
MSKNKKMQRANQVSAATEAQVIETAVVTPVEEPKAEPKVKKPTIAGVMDEVLKVGGTWEQMINAATEKASTLGITAKFSKGLLKGHLAYRTNHQNKAFAKALVLSEEGINIQKES